MYEKELLARVDEEPNENGPAAHDSTSPKNILEDMSNITSQQSSARTAGQISSREKEFKPRFSMIRPLDLKEAHEVQKEENSWDSGKDLTNSQ